MHTSGDPGCWSFSQDSPMTYDNALTWTRAHNQREGDHEPDSLNDGGLCYDIETLEQRRMIHSAGYSPLIGASSEFQAENPSLRDG